MTVKYQWKKAMPMTSSLESTEEQSKSEFAQKNVKSNKHRQMLNNTNQPTHPRVAWQCYSPIHIDLTININRLRAKINY